MKNRLLLIVGCELALAALLAAGVGAQSTVTVTPSITSGDGSVTIPTMSWSTSPALTTGTPCTATATPPTSQWTGAKAGSGTATALGPFSANQRLSLACVFPGDSIVTYTWTNPTTNTNGTPYTNPDIVRIKQTFNPALTTDPAVAASGETHVDVPQTPTPATMRTVTGITSVGDLRAAAFARNTTGGWSGPSNFVMKSFTGNVTVTQSVDITVRTVPNVVTGLGAQ